MWFRQVQTEVISRVAAMWQEVTVKSSPMSRQSAWKCRIWNTHPITSTPPGTWKHPLTRSSAFLLIYLLLSWVSAENNRLQSTKKRSRSLFWLRGGWEGKTEGSAEIMEAPAWLNTSLCSPPLNFSGRDFNAETKSSNFTKDTNQQHFLKPLLGWWNYWEAAEGADIPCSSA